MYHGKCECGKVDDLIATHNGLECIECAIQDYDDNEENPLLSGLSMGEVKDDIYLTNRGRICN